MISGTNLSIIAQNLLGSATIFQTPTMPGEALVLLQAVARRARRRIEPRKGRIGIVCLLTGGRVVPMHGLRLFFTYIRSFNFP